MSIQLMSAIFETEFPDYLSDGEIKTKASTAKLVLLAIADHANDYGESAYPGLTRLQKKTGLSRQGIIDTIKVLKFNGLLLVDDEPSKLHTNNYTVVTKAYPVLAGREDDSQATLLVKPLDYPSQATLPEVVKPLDLNHHITINNHQGNKKIELPKGSDISFQLAAGIPSEEIASQNQTFSLRKEKTDAYERAMGYNKLPWGDKKLMRLERFLETQPIDKILKFAEWSRKDYSTFSPVKARLFPDQVIEFWNLANPEKVVDDYYKPYVPEPHPEYVNLMEDK